MGERSHNVLFLCTGNSARSIMAEAILACAGGENFRAFSAGSFPIGKVNPYAIAQLRQMGYETVRLRSKSWDEFSAPDAPNIDAVLTVCDNAASESCPTWPGHPVSAHWGIPDPAAVEGTEAEKRLAFAETYMALKARISKLINLPVQSLENSNLKRRLDEIGQTTDG